MRRRDSGHHPAERRPVLAHVGPHAVQAAGKGRVGARGGVPVHLEVGPPAEQVVIDARRMGLGGVDLGRSRSHFNTVSGLSNLQRHVGGRYFAEVNGYVFHLSFREARGVDRQIVCTDQKVRNSV